MEDADTHPAASAETSLEVGRLSAEGPTTTAGRSRGPAGAPRVSTAAAASTSTVVMVLRKGQDRHSSRSRKSKC